MNSNNIEEILKDIFGMSLLDAKKIENESKYEKKNLYKNIGYIFSVISIVILTIVSAIDI